MAEAKEGERGGTSGDELRNWLATLTWELEQARQERASISRELRLLKHDLRLAHDPRRTDRRRSVRRLKRHAS